MDQMGEDQLDFEDEEYGGAQKHPFQGASGAISALADEEEPIGDDDDYDDLYNDVNVGEGFFQMHRSEAPVATPGGAGAATNGPQAQKLGLPDRREEIRGSQETSIPGVSASQYHSQKEGILGDKKPEVGSMVYPDGASGSQKGRIAESGQDAQVRRMGFQGSVGSDVAVKIATNEPVQQMSSGVVGGPRGVPQMPGNQIQVSGNVNVNHQVVVSENQMRAPVENGSAMLFVGELHWWTTDAELENVLSQYGRVKEIKFFDERASGKSKGYCQVEFFDAGAAAACKEGMHGHIFNGRACVVAFASPQTLKQMGAAYANKNPIQNQSQPQGRRPGNDGAGRGGNQNFQGGDGGGRGFGRGGGWGRGGQGVLNRGPGTGGPMRGRGGAMGAKNMVSTGPGVGAGASGAGGYGQGLPGPAFGGPAGAMMNPQGMMGSGFDPTYMGRGGGYGGFSGPAFPGMIPSFPGVNPMGLAAVAPHVNPAFFGRGMVANGMGMMGGSLMEGHHGGMWNDPSMGGWGGGGGAGGAGGGGAGGEEHGRRTRESSYGGDDASEYGYGDTNHEKGGRSSGVSRERERGSERDWSGNSEKRHHDERDQDYDRPEKDQREHRYREDKDGYRDHRQKDRGMDYDDDWDRGQSSSKPRSRSRVVAEDHHRSRSRDVDYGKRRRLPSE